MPENKKTVFDKWMDTKIKNAIDSGSDMISQKIQVFLYIFYFVSMLVSVIFSAIALNELGKFSLPLMIAFTIVFSCLFLTMAAISIWNFLSNREDNSEKRKTVKNMATASKVCKIVLSITTYIISIITMLNTWQLGIAYRLFFCIILITLALANLWIIVSGIYKRKLKEEEKKRAELEAKKKHESSLKVKVSENVQKGANKIASGAEKVAIDAKKITHKIADDAKKITTNVTGAIATGSQKTKEKTTEFTEKLKSDTQKMIENSGESMQAILKVCYQKASVGIEKIDVSPETAAKDYLEKYQDRDAAAEACIASQIAKCGTSGFITGLGGLLTLPIAVPANLASVMYLQLHMVATIAAIHGFDPKSEQVESFAYACLVGGAMSDLLKKCGIKLSGKLTKSAISKISAATLAKINQKVGFTMVAKTSVDGVLNVAKIAPLIGGVVGGTIDIATTKIIAENAKKVFSPKEKQEKYHITLTKKKDL